MADRLCLVVCCLLVAGFCAVAAGGEVATEPVALGSVTLYPADRSLVVTGWVNQARGLIELLACGPMGKTHESVFLLTADPLDVQAGLLLLGLKPGKAPTAAGVGRPEGSGVRLTVEWSLDGTNHVARGEEFVRNTDEDKVLPATDWVFTGSKFSEGRFGASLDESFVATYWDPWAIINLPLECGANDEILVVREGFTPPEGTPIRMRFTVGGE
jgi:hypothetical protein